MMEGEIFSSRMMEEERVRLKNDEEFESEIVINSTEDLIPFPSSAIFQMPNISGIQIMHES